MKIGIIGGGAAGLMAAATICENASAATEIFLIERNLELGKKVLISGGGRCNVTTGIRDMRALFEKYPRGAKFLSSALYQFTPEDVYAWFESNGVPLKIEDDLRVFPVSDNGHDVVYALEKKFTEPARVKILLGHTATSIRRTEKKFVIDFKTQPKIIVDKLIITTGGQAYRHTGSTGDGYTFAESLGHTVTPCAASLSSFISRDAWVKSLAGVSFDRVSVSTDRSTPIARAARITGPLMFTHHGITGPAIFAFSAHIAYEPVTPATPLNIFLNFFPDKNLEEVTHMVHDACALNGKRTIVNVIATFIPKSVAEIICTLAEISAEKRAGDMNKKEILRVSETLRALCVCAIGRGAGDEFVTAGGVALNEVNPSTMESCVTPGLFFAGEILDVDGFTGGFNLQASWATGRLAGKAALSS